MPRVSLTVLAASTLLLARSPAEAQTRPNYELAGVLAVSVWTLSAGSEHAGQTCGTDDRDVQRRALFVMNQTRLVIVPGLQGGRHPVIENHPTYRRLKAAQRDAAEQAQRASGDASRTRAREAEEAANRALSPWEYPPLMSISTVPLVASPGICAEYIEMEVTSRIETARVLGSRANTVGPIRLFTAGTLISGPAASMRERRGEVVERYAREFVNAWAEVNRPQ